MAENSSQAENRKAAADGPFAVFEKIYREALELEIRNPNAMTLGTVDASGRPSSRAVLLKDFDRRGFVFYTNLESRKGREIDADPRVCLHFYWRDLDKQIRIEGVAEAVSDEEADAYFATRDRGSQLGAWASRQSRPLTSRARLLAEVAKVEARYLGREVPRPPHWSGLRVVPDYFEFWIARAFRLHDRTAYRRSTEGWERTRLYP